MSLWRVSIVTALVSLCLTASAFSATSYVKSGGTGNGTSWALARGDLRTAMNSAVSGDTIWVARGAYAACCTLKSGVSLYGGFVGTETAVTQRNPKINFTIFQASKKASIINIAKNASSATRLDGVIIAGGRSNTNGSGIYCDSNSSALITGCTIAGNETSISGGGIYCAPTSSPTISGNRIIGNISGMRGAGISTYRSAAKIVNNVIMGNRAGNTGGGVCLHNSTAQIVNNTIVANQANSGGGISIDRGADLPAITVAPTIANNIVMQNSSGICKDGTVSLAIAVYNNCVYQNGSLDYKLVPYSGNNNISSNPLFVNLPIGNVHLTSTSPCINVGRNTDYTGLALSTEGNKDIDGESRPLTTSIDIGADEYGIAPALDTTAIRVATSGSDSASGTSWSSAQRSVQNGVYCAAVTGGAVWVKAGTYFGNTTIMPFVHLFGGFSGTETTLGARNFRTNICTLNGQRNDSSVVLIKAGYAFTTIDGFTITNGKSGKPNASINSNGGAICCQFASTRILNNRMVNNCAQGVGGAVYLFNSSAIIAGNTFSGDTSIGLGGGAVFAKNSPCIITSNLFHHNVALQSDGGAISVNKTWSTTDSVLIINNTIAKNSSLNYGGGIFFDSSKITMANNIVVFNTSGIFKSSGTQTLVTNCVFANGSANYSGFSAAGGLNAGATDFQINPLLVDTSRAVSNYHLTIASSAAGRGTNSRAISAYPDIDGDARINSVDNKVDVGADESAYPVYVPVSAQGVITVGGGQDTVRSRLVSLALSASSPNGTIDSITFANIIGTTTQAFPGFEPYTTTKKSWLLPPNSGTKQVVAKFKSSAGEVFLDTDAVYYRYQKTITINNDVDTVGMAAVTIKLSTTSPQGRMKSMTLATSKDTNGNYLWVSGFYNYDTLASLTLPAGNGLKTVWVIFQDSSGSVFIDSDFVYLKVVPPTASVTISPGQDTVRSRLVSLSMTTSSANGTVDSMTISNMIGTTIVGFPGFEPYSAVRKSWVLPPNSGTKQVVVKFKSSDGEVFFDTGSVYYLYKKTVAINNNADTTPDLAVTLKLSATSPQGPMKSMTIATRKDSIGVWQWVSGFYNYDTVATVTLPAGNGIKTIWVMYMDSSGSVIIDSSSIVLNYIPSLARFGRTIPLVTRFNGAWPNPVRQSAAIHFDIGSALAGAGGIVPVELTLYDMNGTRVRSLVQSHAGAGQYQVAWNGDNERGQRMSAGMYILFFKAGNYIQKRQLVLAR